MREFIFKWLSYVPSAETKSWQSQIWYDHELETVCVVLAHNTGHELLSTGNTRFISWYNKYNNFSGDCGKVVEEQYNYMWNVLIRAGN